MHALIKNHIDDIRRLCKLYDVEAMYLFGSAGSGNMTEDSDIDLLVSFKDHSYETYTNNYFELQRQLKRILGGKIDLITENSLKNPYFIQQVNQTKKLLYAA